MRYSITGPGAYDACVAAGGARVKGYPYLPDLAYADLTLQQVQALQQQGYAVQVLKTSTNHQITAPPLDTIGTLPSLSSGLVYDLTRFSDLFNALTPPLDGSAFPLTVAVLDSGINDSHLDLAGKVLYKRNFTDSPTEDDFFGHGTAVAWLIAGGRDWIGPGGARDNARPQGFAPGAKLLSLKVLNDQGQGNEETVVDGLHEVIRLWEEHPPEVPGGISFDPMGPNVVNLSLGTPDTGDPGDPIRMAVREVFSRNIGVFVSAGNNGPGLGSITSPASDPSCWAIGAVDQGFSVASFSSRGPTKEGLVKPDLAFFGVGLTTADARTEAGYKTVSGTSFASALACGGGVIFVEGILRALQVQPTVFATTQNLSQIAKKPADAPPGKDTAYGWGIPFGDSVAGLLARAQQDLPLASLLAFVPGVALIGMLGGMVRSMMPSSGSRKK